MKTSPTRYAFAVVAAAMTVLAGCGGSEDQDQTAPASGTDKTTAPYRADFSWGTFELNERTAATLEKREPLTIALSGQGQTLPIYSAQYKSGFEAGIEKNSATYPLEGKIISPVNFDTAQQVANIDSALNANQIDCLGLDGGGLDAFIPVINKAISRGVPVFTVGSDQPKSHRLATFLPDYRDDGEVAAQIAVDWADAEGVELKKVAMTSGQYDANWAQDKMIGFRTKLEELAPGVEFVNTEKNALNTGFDPRDVFSQTRAFLAGHRDVQVILQTDVGAEFVNKAIKDLNLESKSIAWNVSEANLRDIEAGVQLATIDILFADQAAHIADACTAFLVDGKVLPDTLDSRAVTKENIAEAREYLNRFGG